MRRPLALCLASSLLLACDPGPEPECEVDDDCDGTLVCMAGRCLAPGTDAGDPDVDAGPRRDAGEGIDSGDGPPPPPRPVARWPFNGATTGSIHGSVVVPEPALTPRFAWEASAGADRYEIQITSECATPGFDACPFDAPAVSESVTETEYRAPVLEVDLTPPVGRRYYWRVRACAETCSAWTRVRYLDVGRQPNDFDGDGYADVLAGAYLDDGGADRAGRAYWWNGSSTGPAARNQIAAPVAEVEGRFGLATAALGDANADGFADALISAYRVDAGDTDTGESYLFLGSMEGLPSSPSVVIPPPVVEANAQFGRAVAPAGDVDGDGFADLLISAHAEDVGGTNLGRAYVFHGGPAGVELPYATRLEGPSAQDNQQFGFPLTGVGDVDGDGFADVLVGERLWDDGMLMNVGRTHLFAGTAAGLSPTAAVTFVDPAPTEMGELSWNVAGIGDIDGDHFADMMIGGRRREMTGGALLFLGGGAGPSTTPAAVLPHSEMQVDAEFGFAIGSGDFDADGDVDVAIGARLFDRAESNEGRAYVYYSVDGGLAPTPDVTLNGSPRENGAQFGYSVVGARDVDGDGIDDLVIGALNQDEGGINHGALFFYRGAAGGLSTSPVTLGTTRLDGRLGSSVALTPAY